MKIRLKKPQMPMHPHMPGRTREGNRAHLEEQEAAKLKQKMKQGGGSKRRVRRLLMNILHMSNPRVA